MGLFTYRIVIFGIFLAFSRVSDSQDTGTWEAWGTWMTPPCPVTCGGSLRILFRTRNCLNGNCSGDGVQLNETICGTSDCTSVFTLWGDWKNSSCSVTCGQGKITQTRTRTCSGTCVGDTVEHRVIDCTEDDCSDGLLPWAEWTYGDCSGTCGVDVTRPGYRQRNCTIQQCSGHLMETKMQNCNLTQCPDGLSPWGEWTYVDCSGTCGANVTRPGYRQRSCTTQQCSGHLMETKMENCNLTQCPVNGRWSVWSTWTSPECTVTCGREAIGRAKRTRSCDKPSPAFGGIPCSGTAEESKTQKCSLDICPVDGEWTLWSSWTTPKCSATCGSEATGTVKRTRTCNKPAPAFGGKNCPGKDEESKKEKCELVNCPGESTLGLTDKERNIVIGVVIAIGLILILIILIFVYLICRKKKQSKRRTSYRSNTQHVHTQPRPHHLTASLKEGCKSGTSSQSRFKRGEWNRAFGDPIYRDNQAGQGQDDDFLD